MKRNHSLIVKHNLILYFFYVISDYSESPKSLFSISQVLSSNSCALITSSSKDQDSRPDQKNDKIP